MHRNEARHVLLSPSDRLWKERICFLLWWIFVVVGMIGGAECSARHWLKDHPKQTPYWEKQSLSVAAGPVDFIFIGSSRVAAAVDADAFSSVVSLRGDRPVRSLNFGMAFSTLQQHFLNLRNLFEQYPEYLQGCHIFLEVPGGLPYFEGINGDRKWYYPERPDLLVTLMKNNDLLELWSSHLTLEDTAQITANYILQNLKLFAHQNYFTARLRDEGEKILISGISKVCRFVPNRQQAVADLSSAGGIRNEQDAVDRARQLAIDIAKRDIELLKAKELDTTPIQLPDWDQSLLVELIRLVTKSGGQVVLFDMPLHSVQAAPYKTQARQRERAAFQEKALSWGVPFISPHFRYQDEDFPDIWHLRKSRAAEFSQSLADAWMAIGV